MAGKSIKGITIQIGADTLGLDKALKGVESASKKASDELREINKTIKVNGDSAVLWKQKQELLTTALEESKKKLELLEGAQEQVNKQFENKSITGDQYRAFQREVEYARGEVERCRDRLQEFGSAAKNSGEDTREAGTIIEKMGESAEEASDDVEDLGQKADKTASGGISAMTVALGNLVADGIKKAAGELKDFTQDVITTGSEFEAAISNVGAISGANANEIEQLSAKAQEMGASTKFTAAESADAFQYMAMAGWKTEDMLSGIDGILNLAAASGEDLATTSDIVTDALTAFGLTAADSSHFADILAAASSNANTNVAMMGETFKYVAPVAGALNISAEDAAEAIGLLANSGIKSSQAGTTLRSILTRLSTDAGASSKSLGALGVLTQELGVEFYDSEGKVRDFGTVLSEAREQWKTLSAEDSSAFAKKIAGEEGISGWLALMNAAPADIEKLSGAIADCDGAAGKMSDTMTDNLQGDFTILNSAIDGAKISLSEKLSPALRDVVQYITKNVPNVEKVLEKGFKKGVEVVDFGIKHIPQITSAVKALKPVIVGTLSAIASYKLFENGKKAIELIKGINAAIALNPYAAAAIGVAALAGALVSLAASYELPKSAAEKALEAEEEYAKKLDDTAKEYQDKKDAAYEAADADLAQVEKADLLWQELQDLADASGNVKDKDKDRVEFILGELNEALGTEYSMTDNQINKYNELKESIEKVIEAKRANILLSANEEIYQEALTKTSETEDQLAIKQGELSQTENRLREIRDEAAAKGLGNISSIDLETGGAILSNAGIDITEYKNLLDLRDKQTDSVQTLQNQLYTYYDDIEKYESASAAILNDNYEEAVKILDNKGKSFISATATMGKDWEEQKEMLDGQVEYYKRIYDNKLKAVKDGHKAISNAEIDAAKENYERAVAEADQVSQSYNTHFANGINETKNLPIDAMNMSAAEMVKAAQGYNSDMYDTGYELQTALFNGMTAAQLYAKDKLIQKGMNSPGDVSMYNAGTYIPFMAEGGFLRSGQAVVAEAGPELLEIMNGGVRVTPLTGAARNTEVNSGTTNKTVNIFNTIKVDKISSDYDVARLSERLSFEERRAEIGKGQ